MELREVMYVEEITRQYPFFLAGDIGGTNANFGIFSCAPERPVLILSLHYKSQKISDFTSFVVELVDYITNYYGISCTSACIGAAGIVYPHRVSVQPTNLPFFINVHDIMQASKLDILLINDFEAVALGRELLPASALLSLNKKGVSRAHANIGFIGAGTGLGKSMLLWHREEHRYLPYASEGGHADAVFITDKEVALRAFIRDEFVGCPVSWEMILSGAGIQRIYHFLGTRKPYSQTDYSLEIAAHDFNPDRISFYAERDQRCRDTFTMYRDFYARVCKNFVLEALALNGIYIAGGIAAKNKQLFFDPAFMQEFTRCGKLHKQLELIPVTLITDYNVSLYGALVAFQLRKEGIL